MNVTFNTVFFSGPDREQLHALATQFFTAYSVTPLQGCYNGELENSWQLTLIGAPETRVRLFARTIKDEYRQESVYVLSEIKTLDII